jgi:hypothetical protein
MKKLLYLLLAITIISCGGDDDGNTNNNSNNLTINPPSWIQGLYLQELPSGQVNSIGYEFKSDDFCTVSSNIFGCYQAQLDLYANTPTFETNVYEESDSNRYFLEITLGVTIYDFEFEKVSSTRIKQIYPTYEATYILQ